MKIPEGDINLYAEGWLYCSVCAPKEMGTATIAKHVNSINPTGLDHGWTISKDKNFNSGEPNPCVCEDDPERRHYLMEC